MAEKDRERTERPTDGPGRGKPGADDEAGSTSQDVPGPETEAERPEDTNERADSRARVVEPGSGKPSPRA